MPQLDVDRILENPNAKIRLLHPTAGFWPGFRVDEFALGGAAQFSNPFEHHLQDKNVQINAVASAFEQFSGINMPIVTLTTKEQTLHQWVGSERPQIPVNIAFIRTDMAKPPTSRYASRLVSKTMPRGEAGGAVTTLKPPGGYDAGNLAGTWTVEIGKFFRADKLVMTSAQASMSEAVVSDGTPLVTMVQCNFEPAMIVTESEMEAWFILG